MKRYSQFLLFFLVCSPVFLFSQVGSSALNFDGSDDYVSASGYDFDTGNFTVEAWIYPRDNNKSGIICQGGYSWYTGFLIDINATGTGSIRLETSSGGSANGTISASNAITTGVWQHVAFSITRGSSGSLSKLYINGTLVASGNVSSNDLSNTTLSIGKITVNMDGHYYNGMIDDVRLWNTARTQAEIQANLNKELIGNETGLVAYYKMNEGFGNMTYDACASRFDGTLVNGVSWFYRPSALSDLVVNGSNIKWYNASTGGTAYLGTEALINGQTYYASQTINGVESQNRLAVTANVTSLPNAATHTATETSITWNWNASTNATGYKWNTTNNYSTATDLGNTRTLTRTGLTCNTSYTIYVWAYNTICNTTAAIFTKSTSACASFIVSSIDFGNGGTANQLDASVGGLKDFIQIVFSKEVNPTTIYSGLTKGGTINTPSISFGGFWNSSSFVMNSSADWHLGTCGETGTAIQDAGSGGDPSVYSLTLSADGTVLTMYLYNAGGRLLNSADANNYLWYTPDSNIKAADGTSISGSYYREPNGSNQF